MAHVWQNGPLDGKLRYVLVALADNANDDGHAFPSIPYLVEKTRIPERTIQRIIAALERDGWLERTLRAGRTLQSGQKTTTYQLHWTPKPKVKGCQNVTPSLSERGARVDEKGCQSEQQGVPKSTAPLINSLTTNEPSGNLPHIETLTGDKAPPPSTPPRVAVQPVAEPPPSRVSLVPPPSWRLSEADRTMVDFVLIASPPGIVAGLTTGAITPVHRVLVIEAVKREAWEHRIAYCEALDGLFAAVKHQSENVPLERLNLFGGFEKYFNKRGYRKDPIHVQERSNGKSKSERFMDNARQAASELAKHFGGADEDGTAAASWRFPGNPKTLHR